MPETAFLAFYSDSTRELIPGRSHCVFRILSLTQPATTYGTSFSLTHNSLLSYSVPTRNKLPIDFVHRSIRIFLNPAMNLTLYWRIISWFNVVMFHMNRHLLGNP